MRRLFCGALAVALLGAAAFVAQAGEPEWIRQFGTLAYDDTRGVAVGRPDGRVHVTGITNGHFGAYKGMPDALVITFDRDGNELWRRQPGTTFGDYPGGIATDADGNVYVAGYTEGALGGLSKGSADAFVIAFDRDGRTLWRRQPGTSSNDFAIAVATDAEGNVYVAGFTDGALGGAGKGGNDAFLIKYDRTGRILWKRQPGTVDSDLAFGVATDGDGNVYLAGYTSGSLGGPNRGSVDVFLIKFDRDGRTLWKRQPGSASEDYVAGVATDGDGGVYVVGQTFGALAGADKRSGDSFLIKFDRDGHALWKRQPGTTFIDRANGVAIDADQNVYLVGMTTGALSGPNEGAGDPFVVKFDRDGHTLWQEQRGTTGIDWATGVAADADGNAYVVGTTSGSLEGDPNLGKGHMFLIKYGPNGPQ